MLNDSDGLADAVRAQLAEQLATSPDDWLWPKPGKLLLVAIWQHDASGCLRPPGDHLIGSGAHPLGQPKEIVLAHPIGQGVRQLS